jgi:molybdopterin converting factor subunit 1
VRVTVRLFARLRDLAGTGELVREIPDSNDATVGGVWESLTADYPSLAPYTGSMSCAVNADYARLTTRVGDGDEVAFLPPVSGGAIVAAADAAMPQRQTE